MTEQKRKDGFSVTPFCEVKERLINDFLEANHVVMDLLNQQAQALIHHDPDFARFDDLIHIAREKKDEAKYALLAHMDGHNC